MLANSSENRLSHLLGAYNSDSDEDGAVTTDWTQCIDKNTGHPYFWNIRTKEVTWQMPAEYKSYLEYVNCNFGENEHRWKAFESDDSNVPYYIDEVTRVVSWEIPEAYKKPLKIKKADKIKAEKSEKKSFKKYPEHLTRFDETEGKIELISSYSMSSGSSSEDENKPKKTEAAKPEKTKESTDVNFLQKEIIPSEELLPYKMYTPDPTSDTHMTENHTSSSTLFNNETSITLSELEKSYSSQMSANVRKSPENTVTEGKVATISHETIDKKLMMRKRRIEIPRISSKVESQTQQTSECSQVDEEKARTSVDENFVSSGTEFCRNNAAECEITEEIDEEQTKKEVKDAATCTSEDEEKDGEDLKELSFLVGAKVKFLSEGRPIVSGVQIMQIQLETLVSAYEAHQLSRSYVMNWLNTTAKSLLQLETDVAPNGWRCKWDRTNSRYYYQSVITGKIQWDFPEPDVSCVGEEMEICTTPPHPAVDVDEPAPKKVKQEKEEDQEIRPPEPPAWDSSPEPPPLLEAPPPPRITDKFHSELDSFYSDLATLETTTNTPDSVPGAPEEETVEEQKTTAKPELHPAPQPPSDQPKPTKKKKVKTSRTELKEMSVLMAKWQKAQEDFKK
ncbi:WW domain [Sergentomyia squamirostris]